jgi:hypothetical protein
VVFSFLRSDSRLAQASVCTLPKIVQHGLVGHAVHHNGIIAERVGVTADDAPVVQPCAACMAISNAVVVSVVVNTVRFIIISISERR